MRRTILVLSIISAVLFSLMFVISFVNPILIERAAREVVRIEVERRVGEKIDTLSNAKVITFAQKALGKTDAEIEATKREMTEGLPQKIATTLADMLDANCECRRRIVEYEIKGHEEKLASLGQLRGNLVGVIESAYSSVTSNLMREFRIFTGSNAIAFLLLALITYWRRGATLQLVLPAFVLVGATFTVGSLYLFNQNWLHTLLYGQYVGFAYIAYLGAAALGLADVSFNKARVTTLMVNAVLTLVGSVAVAVVSC
jgi:hypothetical protein